MAISVVTNVASIRSQRNLAKVTLSTSQNIERLSSGLRINRAGDDAARSAISSQMSALQLGLKQADRNANDNISLVQTAEGALNEVGGIVTRMRELAVQSANEGTMDTTERGYLHQEFNLLRSELDRIVNVTEYNGQKLLDGSISAGTTALDFQVGMNNTANDRISMSSLPPHRRVLALTPIAWLLRVRRRLRSPRWIPHLRQSTPSVRRLVRPKTGCR